ncbi:MAG TPA: hypothetical protein VFF39_04670 [Verrucomicrobiae bacterium]|nr:hypothetical protein [Verrucomicrobiae bacterium]
MKSAAIGIRVHSGWGALVALSDKNGAQEIIDRRKVVITDPKAIGAVQPYHYVEAMELRAAERHLAKCATESRRLAVKALAQVSAELLDRGFTLVGSAILLSSARPLPDLDEVLGSHALIHTAEGEFFRKAFRQAFERLEIPVTGIRERELNDYAKKAFGTATAEVHRNIDSAGRSLGPPWTIDEKTAALAAAIVLAGTKKH